MTQTAAAANAAVTFLAEITAGVVCLARGLAGEGWKKNPTRWSRARACLPANAASCSRFQT